MLPSRALAPPSSEATAAFAAALAHAGRVFSTYDAEYAQGCTLAAEHAFEFLLAHPEQLPFDAEAAGFHTGRYNSSDKDERLWAAAELWETTGDDAYLAWFESNASLPELPLSGRWDWPTVQNLAYFTYLASTRDGRSEPLRAEVATAVTQSAEGLLAEADAHGYGRAIGSHYIWGSNGIQLRAVLNLQAAHRLDADPRYFRAALQQLDHALGVNVYARSQVTGLGYLPPRSPHHRPSGADSVEPPWPGLLVGGANPAPAETGASDTLPALSWQDLQGSYWSNEVAINWNAALVYTLAWAASGPPPAHAQQDVVDAGTPPADASACCDAGFR
jgi:endoglucanase